MLLSAISAKGADRRRFCQLFGDPGGRLEGFPLRAPTWVDLSVEVSVCYVGVPPVVEYVCGFVVVWPPLSNGVVDATSGGGGVVPKVVGGDVNCINKKSDGS